MFVPDGERMAIIIRQALPLSRCVMKQTWKKKKSQDRKRYVVANFCQKKFKSKILHWLGYCKNEEAKQGQNICSSGKPTSLFMILLCFIWKKCEKLLMPGRSLCNQFRIVPGTLHSDPPNTWRPLMSQWGMPDVLTNYFFSQVSCFLPVGRFRPAPSASFSIFASGPV